MNEQPNTPDMIAQAGELLRRFQFGADLTNWTEPHVDRHDIVTGESAIVVASAILAVAGEIRELRNVLADGLLAELVRTDADNAALIARCRSMQDGAA